MYKKLHTITICFFLFSLPILSESKFEIRTGISLSDYQPEFQKRYYSDDLLAGGSNGLGFGAINRDYRQKYYPSAFNPLDFKIHYSAQRLYLLAGIESLGIKGFEASELKSTFNYPAIGFFQGEGNIHSKNQNTNLRFAAGQRFEKMILSGVIMARRFESEYDKNVTLYNAGFLGLVQAESNYKTTNIFAGISLVKFFEKGKITAEISFRPKNSGQVSSSGKSEQAGIIRFPIDILNGNLTSDLLVGNYLYGDKKPNIYGMRFNVDYQVPVFSNVSISLALDYDRLYISYENYQPLAFFRFANNSGISKIEIATAEIISSRIIYKEPILNEIRSLRFGAVLSF